MKMLAVVPARGGSKRLPGKNITPFMGKPLILHTIDAVLAAASKVIVTSDSDEILQVVKENYKNNRIILHKRDSKLASDTSTVLDTIVHLVKEEKESFDYIGLFLPTAPLRDSEDVSLAFKKLVTSAADGIISTTDYEFPPTLGLVVDPDGLLHCSDSSLPFITGNTRSQDHNSVIRPNGAIYIKRWAAFSRDKNFFKGRVINYHMSREKSADIDTKLDLEVAKIMYEQTQGPLGQ
jgi:N-acylneuraminate cytidylyltransferase